jgi:hypothetical protein
MCSPLKFALCGAKFWIKKEPNHVNVIEIMFIFVNPSLLKKICLLVAIMHEQEEMVLCTNQSMAAGECHNVLVR